MIFRGPESFARCLYELWSPGSFLERTYEKNGVLGILSVKPSDGDIKR